MANRIVIARARGPAGPGYAESQEAAVEAIAAKNAAEVYKNEAGGSAEAANDAAMQAGDNRTAAEAAAVTATTQATTATAQAAIATTKAGEAELSAAAAAAAMQVYQNTADGLANTSGSGATNRYFYVPDASADNVLALYINDAGVATDTGKRTADSRSVPDPVVAEVIRPLPPGLAAGMRVRIGHRLYATIDRIRGFYPRKLTLPATAAIDDDLSSTLIERVMSAVIARMFGPLTSESGAVLRFRWGKRLLLEYSPTVGWRPAKMQLPASVTLSDQPSTPLLDRLRPAADLTRIRLWGDSRTAGAGDVAPYTFPNFVASLLPSMSSVGYGIGGQTSLQILNRQGGVPLLLSIAGNTIPASGAVAVTAFSTDIFFSSGVAFAAGSHAGTLYGVQGTYASDGSGAGGLTFTRTSAGDAVAIPQFSPFALDAAAASRNAINFLCAGTNGPGTHLISGAVGDSYETPRLVRAFVDDVLAGGGLPIVAGVIGPNPSTSPDLTANRALNGAIRQAAGRYFVDFLTPPTAEEIAAANAAGLGSTYTPSTQDNADMASGQWPRGLYPDTNHFYRHAQYIQALRVARALIQLGAA